MLGALLFVAVAFSTPAARQVVQSVSTPARAVAVSADGYLAVVTGDDTLQIWHLPSRALIRTISANALAGIAHPPAMAWDDDTHELLVARGSSLLAIDRDGGTRERAGNAARFHAVAGGGVVRMVGDQYGRWSAWDKDGRPIAALSDARGDVAVAGDGATAVATTATGLVRYTLAPVAETTTIALPAPPTAIDDVTDGALAVDRTGDNAAVCVTGQDGRKAVALVHKLGTAHPVVQAVGLPDLFGCQVGFADAAGVLVVAGLDAVFAVDPATGAVRWRTPEAFALTPFAHVLAIAGGVAVISQFDGSLALYDAARGDARGQLGNALIRPKELWFAAGDALVAVRPSLYIGPTTHLAAWKLADGTLASRGDADWGFDHRLRDDGALVVARQDALGAGPVGQHCYHFSSGTVADGAPATAKTTTACVPAADLFGAVDPNHGRVLVVERDAAGKLGYVVVTAGKPTRVVLDRTGIEQASPVIGFSPDGGWLLGYTALGQIGTLWVWDATTGKRRDLTASPKDGPPSIVLGGDNPRRGFTAYDVSADGKLIAVGSLDTVSVYALADGKPRRTVTLPGPIAVTAVAALPDGVVAGTSDGRLVVARDGARAPDIAATAADGGAIQLVRARRDGRRIATVSDDGAVRVWDPRGAVLEATLVEFADGEDLATTPAGAYRGDRVAAERVVWVFDQPAEGFGFERFAADFARPAFVTSRLAGDRRDIATAVTRPPRIALTAAPPPAVSAPTVHVAARADAAAPLREVRAFVEGRAVAGAQPTGSGADVVLDVPLLPGTNSVSLVAFDTGGRASNPTTFRVAAPPGGTRPDVWVVAAGVGWYPNLGSGDQLAGPVNDADSIADAFAAQAGDGKPYATSHVTVLEDEQVTPQALTAAIDGLAAMQPSDVAVVFLAGHGVQLPSGDMVFLTSQAAKDLATIGKTAVGWPALARSLAKARGRVVVLLDACFSGNISQKLIVPSSRLASELVDGERAGVLVFAASRGDEFSLEDDASRGLVLAGAAAQQLAHRPVPARPRPAAEAPATPTAKRPRGGHGYFTSAVLAALDAPSTDADGDGAIEVSELIAQVSLRVARASNGSQNPFVARRELFGDFAVAAAAK